MDKSFLVIVKKPVSDDMMVKIKNHFSEIFLRNDLTDYLREFADQFSDFRIERFAY